MSSALDAALRNALETPVEEVVETPEVEEVEVEETPEVEEVEETPEVEEVVDEEVVETEDDIFPTDISSLAQAINADPKDIYGLQLKLDNGDVTTIGEIKNKYQDLARELETKNKEVEEFSTNAKSNNNMSQAEVAINVEKAQIDNYIQSINWEELHANDPDAYSAKFNEVELMKFKLKESEAKISSSQAEFYQHAFTESHNVIVAKHPELDDVNTHKIVMGELNQLLQSNGYDENTLQTMYTDPLAINMLLDYHKLLKAKESAPQAINKLKKLKQLNSSRPDPDKTKNAAKNAELDGAISKARESRTVADKNKALDMLFR